MNWPVDARVTCRGLDWGECRVALHNADMVMIHCTVHDLVVCGSQDQLVQAGWTLVPQNNIVKLENWRRDRSSSASSNDPSIS